MTSVDKRGGFVGRSMEALAASMRVVGAAVLEFTGGVQGLIDQPPVITTGEQSQNPHKAALDALRAAKFQEPIA